MNDDLASLSTQLAETNVVRCMNVEPSHEFLRTENEDFFQFKDKFKLQSELRVENDDPKCTFKDMTKLIIMEKGEQDFDYLYHKKMNRLNELIYDRITKEELKQKLEYFNNEDSNKYYREQYQKYLEKKKQKKK